MFKSSSQQVLLINIISSGKTSIPIYVKSQEQKTARILAIFQMSHSYIQIETYDAMTYDENYNSPKSFVKIQ